MDCDNEKYIELAESVLKVSRNTLIVNLRFMDSAMSRLYCKSYDGTITTDGQFVYYDPVFVLRSYKQSKKLPTHIYLHMVFHCVFQHFFVDIGKVDRALWDLSCDIAVEAVIRDLHIECTALQDDNERFEALDKLRNKCKFLTAEYIYGYLLDGNEADDVVNQLAELFKFDDHSLWYEYGNKNSSDTEDDSENENGNQTDFSDTSDDFNWGTLREQLKDDWKNVSESMQTAMETFEKEQGSGSGDLIQNLNSVNREKYDYSRFLKNFSVMGEAMKINDDEFDYIFYTYGMQLFDRKMPLIEPLEYKDVKRIKEFVIAIDTSGSVQGDLVQKFLKKTYNILKQEESYFTKINLHIIQCDDEIKEDYKITSEEEFDRYLSTMTLKGFGGTDFRPVFNHVDKMVENKEFVNLKGLIYFTDGYGVFPQKKPNYDAAFVFIEDEYNNYDVPVWAIKLILRSEEI